MTEEEAKTKGCPLYTMAQVVGVAVTGIKVPAPLVACTGSACMLWRRALPLEEKNTQHHNPHSQPEGDGWEWRDGPPGWFRSIVDNGYCGLGGITA